MKYKHKVLMTVVMTILVVIMCIFVFYNTYSDYIEKKSFCEENCANQENIPAECNELNCEFILDKPYLLLLIAPLVLAGGYSVITIWFNIKWVIEEKKKKGENTKI